MVIIQLSGLITNVFPAWCVGALDLVVWQWLSKDQKQAEPDPGHRGQAKEDSNGDTDVSQAGAGHLRCLLRFHNKMLWSVISRVF